MLVFLLSGVSLLLLTGVLGPASTGAGVLGPASTGAGGSMLLLIVEVIFKLINADDR